MDDMKLFSGRAHTDLARRVCEYLGLPLGRAVMGNFPDGEISCKIDEDVRGRDAFVLQPTCPPVNENLMELLIMIESLKRASADRITAVIPYFGYARQDRKDEGRVPITAKLVANIITRAGADRVLTMDLHAAQIQGFFDIPVDHLYAAPVIDDHFRALGLADEDLVVVSPDEGSIKRALAHMGRLGGRLAIIDKRRSSAEETRQAHVIGTQVEGKTALIFDDMISTAGSIVRGGPGDAPGRGEADFPGRHPRPAGGQGRRADRRGADRGPGHYRHDSPAAGEGQSADHRLGHRPPVGRSDQADSLERIGQRAVQVRGAALWLPP